MKALTFSLDRYIPIAAFFKAKAEYVFKIIISNKDSIFDNSSISDIVNKSKDNIAFNNRFIKLCRDYIQSYLETVSKEMDAFIKSIICLKEVDISEVIIKQILKTVIVEQWINNLKSNNALDPLYLKFEDKIVELNNDCIILIIEFLEPSEFIQAFCLHHALAHSFSKAQNLDNLMSNLIGNSSMSNLIGNSSNEEI